MKENRTLPTRSQPATPERSDGGHGGGKMKLAVLVVILVVVLAMPVFAYDWIVNPTNGHYYAVVDCDSWTEAQNKAVVLGEYLVTISDSLENEWVFRNLFILSPGHWAAFMGLSQPNGETDPNAPWQWVTGEPFSFTNWAEGQPSGDGPCGLMFEESGTWNDGTLNWYHAIAFVEVGPIPEPPSFFVILAGIADLTGFTLFRKQKR